MNKKYIISELIKQLNITEEEATTLNSILEDTFIIGRKNKDKIINSIVEKLGKNNEEAEMIYEKSMSIILSGIKEKIKHPIG